MGINFTIKKEEFMKVETTPLKDCWILTPTVYRDERGYFFESFNQEVFEKEVGRSIVFVQDNQSFSKYGVVRGLHAQNGEAAQAKLVRVLQGEILDVAVDMRAESPTYGMHFSVVLNDENKKQLFIPEGFLHGFSVLSESAVVSYKCNHLYVKEAEVGLHPNDPALDIDWKVSADQQIISEKDQSLPYLNQSR